MLITMGNPELIRKLVFIARRDIDLVQRAIRIAASENRRGEADLERVVHLIVGAQPVEKTARMPSSGR